MKKVISLILVLSFVLISIPEFTISVNSSTETVDFVFLKENDTYSVMEYWGDATQVIIPSVANGYEVTGIEDYAFLDKTGITSITIPSTVTSIGDNAFDTCSSLESIIVAEDNAAYSSVNGVLYNKSKTELICYPEGKTDKTFIVPNSVTSIGNNAFFCSSLTEINIPNSVTSIGDKAFCCCYSLTDINIPNSVTSIGYHTFYDCNSLENINIPNGVISIGNFAFENCTSLKSITIPGSVMSIGDYAFSNCTSLSDISMMNGVVAIGERAFDRCRSLTSITIPSSVTSIGLQAFHTSLESIIVSPENVNFASIDGVLYNKNITELIKYPYKKADTTFIVPNSVTVIKESAFQGSSLANLYLPNSVTTIEKSAFRNCFSLSITIPNSVTTIGYGAFFCTLVNVNYIGSKKQFEEIIIEDHNENLINSNLNYLVLSIDDENISAEYNSSKKPILPVSYTSSKNKHFLILGWNDKNGNKVDIATLTEDNMIPLVAITTEIPVAPERLQADLVPVNDEGLSSGNKYVNGLYIQGAQVRVPSDENGQRAGLRFINVVDNNLMEALKTNEDVTDINLGTIVISSERYNGGELNLEYSNATNVSGEKIFKNATHFDNQYFKYTACIVKIPKEKYETALVVRPYISFTYKGNVVTLYGEQYSTASLYSTAKLAIAENSTETEEVKEWITKNIIQIVEQGDNDVQIEF